jgi:uncharacterized protein YdaU (DUF1376 family)
VPGFVGKMNRSPAFQFYPNDFLSDPNTLVMTAEAIGAYWLLICTCWKQDGLPVDVKKLSQIARVREKKFSLLWEQYISVCFYQDPNTKLFRHKRLDKELEKQRLNSEKHTKAANARWKNEDANAMHMHSTRNAGHMHGNALHTSSSSSSSSSTAVKKTVLRTGGKTADPDTSPVDKAPDADPVERRIWKDGIDLLFKRRND